MRLWESDFNSVRKLFEVILVRAKVGSTVKESCLRSCDET